MFMDLWFTFFKYAFKFIKKLTWHFNRSSISAKAVVGHAWVISKIGFLYIPEGQNMSVPIHVHLTGIGLIQQHCIFVPFYLWTSEWKIIYFQYLVFYIQINIISLLIVNVINKCNSKISFHLLLYSGLDL